MGRILNLHHVLAHAPKLSKASAQIGVCAALRDVDAAALCRARNRARRHEQRQRQNTELQQHKPMLLAEGFPLKEIQRAGEMAVEQAVRREERCDPRLGADQMSNKGNVSGQGL